MYNIYTTLCAFSNDIKRPPARDNVRYRFTVVCVVTASSVIVDVVGRVVVVARTVDVGFGASRYARWRLSVRVAVVVCECRCVTAERVVGSAACLAAYVLLRILIVCVRHNNSFGRNRFRQQRYKVVNMYRTLRRIAGRRPHDGDLTGTLVYVPRPTTSLVRGCLSNEELRGGKNIWMGHPVTALSANITIFRSES